MRSFKKQIVDFQKHLLTWYDRHHRKLPFRESKNPYHVWLSEIMLQQTTMNTVLPYYERFLKAFPDLKAVANAKEQDLLKIWQGLGYYSRVKNFQKGCRKVLQEYNGHIPKTVFELKKLKGIGDYTAAAIASICFNEKRATVDGNVKRVLARVFYYDKNSQAKEADAFFLKKADALLDRKRPGDFNQALMEVGAMVCRPKRPMCLICPLQKFCAAKTKDPEKLPLKKKQNFVEVDYHALLLQKDGKLLLKKPTTTNLIKNMWELPSHYEQKQSPENTWKKIFKTPPKFFEKIGTVKHSIMNQKITAHVYLAEKKALRSKDYAFMKRLDLDGIALNTLSKKIVKKFGNMLMKNP